MTRRYGILLALVVAGAIAVAALARRPREARVAEAPAALPVTTLALRWDGTRLAPEAASVPKGHRVLLRIDNAGGEPVTLVLAGYEDRVRAEVAPGATWRGELVADRPGADFAWLAGGEPRGRLAVTGSHLVEGHR